VQMVYRVSRSYV